MNTLLKTLSLFTLLALFTNCEKENNPPILEGVQDEYIITIPNNAPEKLTVANFKSLVIEPDGDPISFEVESSRFVIGRESGLLEVLNLQDGESISTFLTVYDGELSVQQAIRVKGIANTTMFVEITDSLGNILSDIPSFNTFSINGDFLANLQIIDPDGINASIWTSANISAEANGNGSFTLRASPSNNGNGTETISITNNDTFGVETLFLTVIYDVVWINCGVDYGTLVDSNGVLLFPDDNGDPFADKFIRGLGDTILITFNGGIFVHELEAHFYDFSQIQNNVLSVWNQSNNQNLENIIDALFINHAPSSGIGNFINDTQNRKLIATSQNGNNIIFQMSYNEVGQALIGMGKVIGWYINNAATSTTVDKFTNGKNLKLCRAINANPSFFQNNTARAFIELAEYFM